MITQSRKSFQLVRGIVETFDNLKFKVHRWAKSDEEEMGEKGGWDIFVPYLRIVTPLTLLPALYNHPFSPFMHCWMFALALLDRKPRPVVLVLVLASSSASPLCFEDALIKFNVGIHCHFRRRNVWLVTWTRPFLIILAASLAWECKSNILKWNLMKKGSRKMFSKIIF